VHYAPKYDVSTQVYLLRAVVMASGLSAPLLAVHAYYTYDALCQQLPLCCLRRLQAHAQGLRFFGVTDTASQGFQRAAPFLNVDVTAPLCAPQFMSVKQDCNQDSNSIIVQETCDLQDPNPVDIRSRVLSTQQHPASTGKIAQSANHHLALGIHACGRFQQETMQLKYVT
jgi:hypothetical protein